MNRVYFFLTLKTPNNKLVYINPEHISAIRPGLSDNSTEIVFDNGTQIVQGTPKEILEDFVIQSNKLNG